jgi:hypothetical protein
MKGIALVFYGYYLLRSFKTLFKLVDLVWRNGWVGISRRDFDKWPIAQTMKIPKPPNDAVAELC